MRGPQSVWPKVLLCPSAVQPFWHCDQTTEEITVEAVQSKLKSKLIEHHQLTRPCVSGRGRGLDTNLHMQRMRKPSRQDFDHAHAWLPCEPSLVFLF